MARFAGVRIHPRNPWVSKRTPSQKNPPKRTLPQKPLGVQKKPQKKPGCPKETRPKRNPPKEPLSKEPPKEPCQKKPRSVRRGSWTACPYPAELPEPWHRELIRSEPGNTLALTGSVAELDSDPDSESRIGENAADTIQRFFSEMALRKQLNGSLVALCGQKIAGWRQLQPA